MMLLVLICHVSANVCFFWLLIKYYFVEKVRSVSGFFTLHSRYKSGAQTVIQTLNLTLQKKRQTHIIHSRNSHIILILQPNWRNLIWKKKCMSLKNLNVDIISLESCSFRKLWEIALLEQFANCGNTFMILLLS